jgi:hypothetical protein
MTDGERRGTVQQTGEAYPPTGRRNGDAILDVAVDHFKNGAQRKIRRLEVFAGSGLLALLFSGAMLFWRGGEFVEHINAEFRFAATRDSAILVEIRRDRDRIADHEESDDIRTEALAEGIASITKTMAVQVAIQEQLLERLRRLEEGRR